MRSAIARASVRERTVKSHTVLLLVELLCANTFMLVDLQAIAAKTPAARCLSYDT